MHLSRVGCRGFRSGLEETVGGTVGDGGGDLMDGLEVSGVIAVDLLELVDEGFDGTCGMIQDQREGC